MKSRKAEGRKQKAVGRKQEAEGSNEIQKAEGNGRSFNSLPSAFCFLPSVCTSSLIPPPSSLPLLCIADGFRLYDGIVGARVVVQITLVDAQE